MLSSAPPFLKHLGYSTVLAVVLAAQPFTVVVSAQPVPPVQHGIPLNSPNATDLPEEIEDLPVRTTHGVLVGHVSDVRMDPRSTQFRVQAVQITADDVSTAAPLSWWVDAQRISITPDAIILASPGDQQASAVSR